jgi:hypothetical protein
MKKHLITLSFIILSVFLSYWAIKSLFVSGFFPVHDDTQPSRIFVMAKAISDGQFPVRLVSGLGYGYGYPIFNFYAPLPYYIGALFYLLGYGAIISAKMMYGIGILLSAVSMFLLGQRLKGNIAGITASVLYVYAPYHAVNIYIRGAVGEYYAYALLPLLILGVILLNNKENNTDFKKGLIFTPLVICGILLSHNIIGFITLLFMLISILIIMFYQYFSGKQIRKLFILASCILLGIGLSAFFILPAITEKNYTNVEKLTQGGSNYSQNFVYIDQLWDSSWGFAGSTAGRSDGMSFKIGKINIFTAFIAFMMILYFFYRKKTGKPVVKTVNDEKEINRTVIIWIYFGCIAVLLVSIFFMLEVSSIFWRIIPLMSYIQYPWRFLNFAALSLSVLSTGLFYFPNRKIINILAFFLVFSVIFINGKYFLPKEFVSIKDNDYTAGDNLLYKISKISDEYLPLDFITPVSVEMVARTAITETAAVKVLSKTEKTTLKEFDLSVSSNHLLITNVAFFPGWQVFIDGKRQNIISRDGKIAAYLSYGNHSLILIFNNTLIRIMANAISIFSLFLLLYVSLLSRSDSLIWPKKRNR